MPAELKIPPGALTDKNSEEVVRAWAAHDGLQCSLDVHVWPDDKGIRWGILLSDIARYVADALYLTKKLEKERTLAQIRAVFNSELDKPTAEATGKFI